MKEADKDIGSTQKRLKSLQDSLKLKWDNKKFVQAQQQTQKALEATEQKADLLRKRLSDMKSAGVTDETRDEYNYLEEQLAKTELAGQKLEEQLKQLDNIKLNNLTSGLDKTTDKLNKASNATKGISVAATAAVVGINALGGSAASKGGELQDFADRLGVAAEEIQRYNYIALQSGVETEQLVKSIAKSRDAIGTAMSGTVNTATKALQVLFGDLSAIPQNTEEGFDAIIEKLSQVEDSTLQAYYANEIFGERLATNLIPLINNGADRLDQLNSEFEEIGYLTNEQVQSLADFDDELNIMKEQLSLAKIELGMEMIPIMKEFLAILKDSIIPAIKGVTEWFGNLSPTMQGVITKVLLLLVALSPMLKLFSGITKGISSLIKWFAKLNVATLGVYARWALLLAAVGNLFNLFTNWSKMNTVQKVIGLLGALSAAALAAAIAFGAFHSAWSLGLAVAGIVAGIAATTAAVNAAGKDIGIDAEIPEPDILSGDSGYTAPDYSIPKGASSSSSVTNNSSNYVDNSNIVINIEKNEYMSEDDIIDAVNKGLRRAKQART